MKIIYWHFIFYIFKILIVSTTAAENENAEIITTENIKSSIFTSSAFHSPMIINNIPKKAVHWKNLSRQGKRHRKHIQKRHHHNPPSLPSKTGSIMSFSIDPKEIKTNFSTSMSNNNDALRTMINLTQELINFGKISSSLLSQLPAVANNNNNYNMPGLMMSKNIKQEKDKSSVNNTNNPGFSIKFESIYEVPVTCNKSKNSSSHLCSQQHSSISTGSLINIGLPLSAKNSIPTQNNLLIFFTTHNASANIQHQSTSTHSSLKSTTKSPSLAKRRVPKFLQGTNNETTQTSFLIIDGFGVFEDGPVLEDIPVIPERVENIKPKLKPVFDIFGENINNARWSEDGWRRWNGWNIESDKLEKFPEPSNDQHLPWTFKDNFQTPIVSKNNFNDFIKEKKMDTIIGMSKDKKMDMNIDISKISNGKNETRVARKAIPKKDFQSTFLSTFYISIVVCGLFFTIGVWWRRLSLSKRANFSTISDSIHSSSPRDSHKPLIA